MFERIRKKNGFIVPFEPKKIAESIWKAAREIGGKDYELSKKIGRDVVEYLKKKYKNRETLLTTAEVGDAVEKVLIEGGHAQTAKSYILHRYRESQNDQLPPSDIAIDRMKKKGNNDRESTAMAIFVQTKPQALADSSYFVGDVGATDRIKNWNRQAIVDALIREAEVDPVTADKISRLVENEIIVSNLTNVTSSSIRELVDAKLIVMGLEEAHRRHRRLGVPVYDVDSIMTSPNKENANVPHCPEATNLFLAECIKKEYALSRVFSRDVADAHIRGDIHLHDLGFIDRPYCSGQSLEYIKKFGLDLPNAFSIAKPPRHPEVLLGQMIKFSAALQGHFAGAIGWDAVNIFFAPFLEGMNEKDMKQLAQMLVFEFSQQAVARGGQAIFSDINLYWEVPTHFENVPAIGPGGEYTGKTYGEYGELARKFVWALFDVYMEGDGLGRPFFFPKPLVHITERFFQTPGHEEFLRHICRVASHKGSTYFVFDRGETAKISQCCRLAFQLNKTDLDDARHPWKMRYCALMNVTLNLPRIAYISARNENLLMENITRMMELAAKAHLQKTEFITRLLELGTGGPLGLLAMARDGEPYLRMDRATSLIGMVGLNELVKYHTGHELHESNAAFKFGLKVISHMKLEAERLSKKYNRRFVLEQTPAESTAYRFAKLDMEYFPDRASGVVQGSIPRDEIYYTNSTYLNNSFVLDPIERVKKEGLFHPIIEAGALTHIWLGDAEPSAESLAAFVKKTFECTENAQIAFSPEFTTCYDCGKTGRGLRENCEFCSSERIDGITRITGYFTRISTWNKGKIGELRNRYRNAKYLRGRKKKIESVTDV